MTDAPLLEMRGVTKSFGGAQALRGVDFDLQRGEIHALLGENGAGKSTLMNILSGVIAPDAGEMRLEGEPVRFADPRAAQAAGVATIFQELDLVPSLDVTANLFLGRELTRAGVLDRAAMREGARRGSTALGIEFDVDQPVGELSVGRRQIVAIAKALTYASRILVMDEPTAALTAAEVERLFALMREIAGRGVGIVFISHRLEEVPRVADRVTVLRDGHVAGQTSPRAPQSELVSLLVGRPLTELFPPRGAQFGAPVLRLDRAAFQPKIPRPGWQAPHDVTLTVRAGEIVGLAGIMGAGRTELLTALYGAAGGGQWRGAVEIAGRPAMLNSIRGARARGLGFVTDDRRGSGLMLRDTVGRNLVSAVLKRVSPGFLMSAARESKLAREAIKLFDVRPPRPDLAVGALVGRQSAEGRDRQGSARRAAAAAARRADARRRRRRQGRDLRPHPRARGRGPGRAGRVERDAGAAWPLRPRRRAARRADGRGISRRAHPSMTCSPSPRRAKRHEEEGEHDRSRSTPPLPPRRRPRLDPLAIAVRFQSVIGLCWWRSAA